MKYCIHRANILREHLPTRIVHLQPGTSSTYAHIITIHKTFLTSLLTLMLHTRKYGLYMHTFTILQTINYYFNVRGGKFLITNYSYLLQFHIKYANEFRNCYNAVADEKMN